MSNKKALEKYHDSLIEPPIDYFTLESWNETEIYQNEQYFQMDNGDLVLDEIETIRDYMLSNGTLKTAGSDE